MSLELGFAAKGGLGRQQAEGEVILGCSRVEKGTYKLKIQGQRKGGGEIKPRVRGDNACCISSAGVLVLEGTGRVISQPGSSLAFIIAILRPPSAPAPRWSYCSLLGCSQPWTPLAQAHEGCLLGLMEAMTELKWAGFGPNRGGRQE